jgi:hypothetical protein
MAHLFVEKRRLALVHLDRVEKVGAYSIPRSFGQQVNESKKQHFDRVACAYFLAAEQAVENDERGGKINTLLSSIKERGPAAKLKMAWSTSKTSRKKREHGRKRRPSVTSE